MDASVTRVGVAAIIVDKENRLLVGKRKSSHGAGTWQLPGGHLELNEDHVDCAVRETLEETGLHVKGAKIVAVTNSVFDEDCKHYITLFVWCQMEDYEQEPKVLEPEKCAGWHWKTLQEVKDIKGSSQPGKVLFLPLDKLVGLTDDLAQLRPENVTLVST